MAAFINTLTLPTGSTHGLSIYLHLVDWEMYSSYFFSYIYIHMHIYLHTYVPYLDSVGTGN